MNLSYWEQQSWFSNLQFTIVGSGIVGLSCALQLKKLYPKANILILERGRLPQGASTKNAGFACFGSLSEILSDLKSHSPEEVLELVKQRYDGLKLLRETLGDKTIEFKNLGGYELFTEQDSYFYKECIAQRETINTLLKPIFNTEVFQLKTNPFQFKNIQDQLVFNPFEGQIHTGKMMEALLRKVQSKGIKILNSTSVSTFEEYGNYVEVKTDELVFKTSKLIIATNGFASQLIQAQVKPARAQVIITKPIKNLHIKGTFHLDRGYYYFRNIDNRILLGGGRQLDFKTEETTEFGTTSKVQKALRDLLKEVVLPNTPHDIEYSWSGIMGVGQQKKSIVKQISNNVFCGVRLGGMGVAIGSIIGKSLAEIVKN
ncbi:NAD(P)/FAD-dependent oxidoreductase [Formosa sp. A9]|uniref:NAD(P)/FAD-dependent oxidoreductase n=1 Tax=Formosa sp. A9 TaxID=3442641 RepID=UPI003EB8AB87